MDTIKNNITLKIQIYTAILYDYIVLLLYDYIICLKFMKDQIFNIKILSFSNGHGVKNFEGLVNLTVEIYCRDPVTSFYSCKIKFICLDFS